ncbi:MAG: chemotaxis response regulator protein-glutamate methylesterase [Paenibacillaceae bacterium]
MNPRRKIRVLVVDDSLLFRESLAIGIAADPSIEVIATAADPFIARDRIIEYEPDVMTLDVEMPRMSGIEFLRRLMPQYPIPVVVVSSLSENVFDALNAGAVEFVTKPDSRTERGMAYFINELTIKIKVASVANVSEWKANVTNSSLGGEKVNTDSNIKVIAMGASTGGTEATYQLLKSFSRDMPGIVIVQHMPPIFTRMFAERLNNKTLLEVKEAESGDKLYPGRVLIAAGNTQMRLKKTGSTYAVECYPGEKVSGHCPSVDVLFESVAEAAGTNAMGVILTGMGSDGAKGLLAMRRRGARTIGQDEGSSIVYGMPKVAYTLGAVEIQASLGTMPQVIYSIVNGR